MATLQELENAKLVTIDNLGTIKQYIDAETELTSQDVIQALGYTPATEKTVPIFSLEIRDGDLIMHYADDSSQPLAYINENGELIMNL